MPLRVGVNATPVELPATILGYPGLASCRVFGAAGKGIPGWDHPAMVLLRRAGVTCWPSFKDWADDRTATAMVTTWLNAMPDVSEVWLTYHHEPEGDLDPNLYRARWVALTRTVRAHRNGPRVKLVPIHNLYSARYKIYDRYSSDWATWPGVWQAWAPTDSAGNYLGDYMGWDCYQLLSATRYEDPSTFFSVPVGAAIQARVPLVIPELGAIRVGVDQTGTGRAQWITDCVSYLRQAGGVAVNWWNAQGANNADYRLSDRPSAQAWKAAVAGH